MSTVRKALRNHLRAILEAQLQIDDPANPGTPISPRITTNKVNPVHRPTDLPLVNIRYEDETGDNDTGTPRVNKSLPLVFDCYAAARSVGESMDDSLDDLAAAVEDLVLAKEGLGKRGTSPPAALAEVEDPEYVGTSFSFPDKTEVAYGIATVRFRYDYSRAYTEHGSELVDLETVHADYSTGEAPEDFPAGADTIEDLEQ